MKRQEWKEFIEKTFKNDGNWRAESIGVMDNNTHTTNVHNAETLDLIAPKELIDDYGVFDLKATIVDNGTVHFIFNTKDNVDINKLNCVLDKLFEYEDIVELFVTPLTDLISRFDAVFIF